MKTTLWDVKQVFYDKLSDLFKQRSKLDSLLSKESIALSGELDHLQYALRVIEEAEKEGKL